MGDKACGKTVIFFYFKQTKMKLQTTLLALVLTLSVNAQEWISDSECKSESAKIISQYNK